MANEQQEIQLAPGIANLGPIEQFNLRHQAKIPRGVTKDDILKPSFWAHHAIRLRPHDEIKAVAEDGTWIAYLTVLDCSRNWARVQMLAHYTLTSTDVSLTQASNEEVNTEAQKYEIKFRGPLKFSLIRKSDGAVIEEGIATKDEAEKRLDAYARKLVGAPVKLPA